MTKPRSNAYELLSRVYELSKYKTKQNISSAMRSTLAALIVGHIQFQPDDIARAVKDCRTRDGWLNREGRLYEEAIESGNTSACIAFETWFGRPAALWSENTKTPERLHLGSRFTWEGCIVEITSMAKDRFVACYSKPEHEGSSGKHKAGSVHYLFGDYRKIEDRKDMEDGSILLRCGPKLAGHDYHRVKRDKVFKITYEELAAKRKEYDKAARTALKEIADAETPEQLAVISERLSLTRNTFRHFDWETIREAIQESPKRFERAKNERQLAAERAERQRAQETAQAARMEQWLAGENVSPYFATVKLRVKDNRVETSTGQSVTLESVKEMLPWALKFHRSLVRRSVRLAARNTHANKKVDLFEVEEFGLEYVKVGCTRIPWSEVLRLAAILKEAA